MASIIKAGDWSKPCLDCGKSPADGVEFGIGNTKNGKQYRKSYCRGCVRTRASLHYKEHPDMAKAREARRGPRDWVANTAQRWATCDHAERRKMIRRNNVRRVFGISLEDYEFRFSQQGGCCSICETEISLGRNGPGRPAHLDHNHETGEIREFLCDRCNVMVGMSGESQDILSQAILYLEKYNGR